MKILIGLLLSVLSVTGYVETVYGQAKTSAQSTLWKIEKPDYKTSYLLGTMHVSNPSVTNFPNEIVSVMETADQLIVEVSMDPKAKEMVLERMRLKEGDSLANYISAEEIEVVKARLAYHPFFAQNFMLMKPWAVTVFLSLPRDVGVPMDSLIQNRFEDDGKPVGQLESVIEQLAVFDKLSPADQVDMLQETIKYLPKMDDLLARMFDLYLKGDLEGLLTMSEEYIQTTNNKTLPHLMHELIDVRNVRMAERVTSYLDQGNVLISIGALHLPGELGLIALLEKSGYRLTPIPLTRYTTVSSKTTRLSP